MFEHEEVDNNEEPESPQSKYLPRSVFKVKLLLYNLSLNTKKLVDVEQAFI